MQAIERQTQNCAVAPKLDITMSLIKPQLQGQMPHIHDDTSVSGSWHRHAMGMHGDPHQDAIYAKCCTKIGYRINLQLTQLSYRKMKEVDSHEWQHNFQSRTLRLRFFTSRIHKRKHFYSYCISCMCGTFLRTLKPIKFKNRYKISLHFRQKHCPSSTISHSFTKYDRTNWNLDWRHGFIATIIFTSACGTILFVICICVYIGHCTAKIAYARIFGLSDIYNITF